MIELDIIWVSSLYKPATPASGDEPNVVSKDISWGEQIYIKSGNQRIPGTFEGQLEPHQSFIASSINGATNPQGKLAPLLAHVTSPGFWGVKGRDPISLVASHMPR